MQLVIFVSYILLKPTPIPMVFIKNNPFIRLLLPFIAGIVLQYFFLFEKIIVSAFFAVAFLSAILFLLIKLPYHLQYLKGIAISCFLIATGLLLTYLADTEYKIVSNEKEAVFVGEIVKVPTEREKNYKTEINIEAQKENNYWKEVNAKAIAYFEKGDSLLGLKAGDRIIFSTRLQAIKENKNPFGFDYAKYLALKQIGHSVYIRNNNWAKLTENSGRLKTRALNLRQKIIALFTAHNIKGNNLSVLSALTLGYKNKIDEKVRKAYSGAGAMHVLAVSGLHVGIIYLVLSFLLGWLSVFKSLKKVKLIIILFALWMYAFLTGLSPSVMRATVMFSFVLVGKIFDKNINIYNSLAASAFLLLLINPFLLFEVSFQLSYIAVLGIVYFHPKIYGLFYFKYKLINAVWSLTAVSIAAQLATFPITIFYFHQFPVYFWLANIVVTITAGILMLLSMVLVAVSALPAISEFIGIIINFILNGNYMYIQFINNLPYSTVNSISFSSFQVIILYVLIFGFSVWLITKKYHALIAGLLSVFVLGMLNINENIKRDKQSTICVYQVQGETAIQFIHKQQAWWLLSAKNKKSRIEPHIAMANMYWKTGTNSYYLLKNLNDSIIKNGNWYYNSGFWKFKQSKGLVIGTYSNMPKNPVDSLFINYLFVTGSPPFTFNDLPNKLFFNNIVIDGSVPYWKVRKFIPDKSKANIFVTNEQGAFIYNNDM